MAASSFDRSEEDAWIWKALERDGEKSSEEMYNMIKTQRIDNGKMYDDYKFFDGRLTPATSDLWAAGLTILEMFAGTREWPVGKGERGLAAAEKYLARRQGACMCA